MAQHSLINGLLLAACGILLLAGGSQAVETRLSADDFAILPWGGTPGGEDTMKTVYDCGFNLAGFVAPGDVDTAWKAGLKSFVINGDVTSGISGRLTDPKEIAGIVNTAVEPLKNHPGVYGWYLRDEPDAPMLNVLGKWCDAFRAAVPNQRPYVNLFPIYVNYEAIGVKSYEEYVELSVSKCSPSFLSYDNYSLMADGSLRDGYFKNLEVMRDASLKHSIPFWNIVLSNSHFHYADPSDITFRFQAFTTLAYGARGISYFTYFTPQTGNYRKGPIDQFGNKTATWDALRQVNLQIHALGGVYKGLKSVNVFHHPNVPEGSRGIGTAKHVVEITGGDFVVGEFEDAKGRPYAMVVNKSLKDSCNFGIKLKKGGAISVVNSYTGQTHPWVGENNWLAPGQGMLLFVGE